MTVVPDPRRPIARLGAAVVDRIAAGEVVDRPGSVVRELIDNALDADASLIQVELRGGGLDLIRVADDGCGIPPAELPLAFQRHSTSKLASLEELSGVTTFGFRGEALPSIAAVAEVEIASSVSAGEPARRALFRNGQLIEQGSIARERGTTIWVRGLFAGLPTRLRFLREPRAEVAAVARRVRWAAVANPSVRFELVVDGRVLFRASGSKRLELALAEAHGDDLRHRLVALGPLDIGDARIEGLLSVAGLTRPSRQHLALFVNRRRVRVAALDSALESGYSGLLPAGRHPVGAIFITAPPASVDLNVHPSKEQVRLRAETELARALTQAVRTCLQASPREPEQLEPFELSLPSLRSRQLAEGRGFWESDQAARPAPRYLAQLHTALLLCETRQGLVLIDQHRAHERVIYERLKQAPSPGPTQTLLEPAVVEIPPALTPLVETRLADLRALGFEYEPFGDHAFRLRAAPAVPDGIELLTFAGEALSLAGERDEFWRDRLLATVACRSAVKKGRPLPALQASSLLDDLFHTAEPTICPHGSPILLQLSRPFLRRQFRW